MASLEAVTIQVALNEPEQRALQHETSEPYGQEVRANILAKLRDALAAASDTQLPSMAEGRIDFVCRVSEPRRDQPKDCGGSGRITEKRRAPVTEEWFRADEGPCPGCNHPDCPNRDQAKDQG